jgi:D-3-phosphoglycerate dehydrogenase / 2-oxoglutarate reductase
VSAGASGRRVAVFEPIDPAGLEVLNGEAEVLRLWELPERGREAAAQTCQGWLVRVHPLPAAFIESAPDLRIIAKHGVGVDNIDVPAATARRIVVTTTAAANSLAVAEHSVAMMLALAKRLDESDRMVREGRFGQKFGFATSELAGKTLGLLGCGRIGTMVANICGRGLGMQVLVYDPYLSDEALAGIGARRADTIAELASRSDVVSVHAPLTADTRQIVNAEVLGQMRPTALLINCARGELVDQRALAAALEHGTIAGAGIDVFEQEPPAADDPLLRQPNALLSPHVANASAESLVRMAVTSAEEVLLVLQGEEPRFAINLPFPTG